MTHSLSLILYVGFNSFLNHDAIGSGDSFYAIDTIRGTDSFCWLDSIALRDSFSVIGTIKKPDFICNTNPYIVSFYYE